MASVGSPTLLPPPSPISRSRRDEDEQCDSLVGKPPMVDAVDAAVAASAEPSVDRAETPPRPAPPTPSPPPRSAVSPVDRVSPERPEAPERPAGPEVSSPDPNSSSEPSVDDGSAAAAAATAAVALAVDFAVDLAADPVADADDAIPDPDAMTEEEYAKRVQDRRKFKEKHKAYLHKIKMKKSKAKDEELQLVRQKESKRRRLKALVLGSGGGSAPIDGDEGAAASDAAMAAAGSGVAAARAMKGAVKEANAGSSASCFGRAALPRAVACPPLVGACASPKVRGGGRRGGRDRVGGNAGNNGSGDTLDNDSNDDNDDGDDDGDDGGDVSVSRASTGSSGFFKRLKENQERKSLEAGAETCFDFNRFKKKHQLEEGVKIFSVTGWYPELKKALEERGWFFNADRESPFWDYKFCLKSKEISAMAKALKPHQVVNHFVKASTITTKVGLLRSMRNLCWFDAADIDTFFPRCYDLNDPGEMDDFCIDNTCVTAERVLCLVNNAATTGASSASKSCGGASAEPASTDAGDAGEAEKGCVNTGEGDEGKAAGEAVGDSARSKSGGGGLLVNMGVVNVALSVLAKLHTVDDDEAIDRPMTAPVVTEWEARVLRTCDVFEECPAPQATAEYLEKAGRKALRVLTGPAPESDVRSSTGASSSGSGRGPGGRRRGSNRQARPTHAAADFETLRAPGADVLSSVSRTLATHREQVGPQWSINGSVPRNIWIVKPAGKSRGRGIAVFDSLDAIMAYVTPRGALEGAGPMESQWMVQKYIENPSTVHKRKFDIRQWVLVTNWNPLTIFFYNDCYLRFCVNEYNLDTADLSDNFVHLANNSISKNSDMFTATPIEGSMWSSDQYSDYLKETTGNGDVFHDTIQPRLKQIVAWSLMSAQDTIGHRKNSFELYGYDFMIDENLNSWLIEVNSSPAMDYSTDVTETLVKAVLHDIVKVTVDFEEHIQQVGKSKKKKKRGAPAGPSATEFREAAAEFDTGRWELIHHADVTVERPIAALGADFVCRGTPMISKRTLAARRRVISLPERRNSSDDSSAAAPAARSSGVSSTTAEAAVRRPAARPRPPRAAGTSDVASSGGGNNWRMAPPQSQGQPQAQGQSQSQSPSIPPPSRSVSQAAAASARRRDLQHQKQAHRRMQKHAPVFHRDIPPAVPGGPHNPNTADIILRNMAVNAPQRPVKRTAVPMASQLFDAQLPIMPMPPVAHPVPTVRGRPLRL